MPCLSRQGGNVAGKLAMAFSWQSCKRLSIRIARILRLQLFPAPFRRTKGEPWAHPLFPAGGNCSVSGPEHTGDWHQSFGAAL